MTPTRFQFLALLIVAFVMMAIASSSKATDDDKLEYGIMIDAGSSGTRTFIYSWKYRELDAQSKQTGPLSRPVTQETWSKKFKIPISDFATKPQEVGTLLQQTVDFAQSKLNEFKIKNLNLTTIPIFLGATAGARMMAYQQRVELFNSVRQFFHSDKSPFEFRDHYAKVLSGEEEGFFGFVAVNYLTGRLYPNSTNTPSLDLIGALDMGGASTQITFDTRGADIMEHYFEYATPDDNRFGLYTTSFLQFGMNEWWNRLNDQATANVEDTAQPIIMKCLGEGFEYEWTNSKSQKKYIIKGSAGQQWDGCLVENRHLLMLDTPCLTGSCSINGSYQPLIPPKSELYGFSGFVNIFSSYEPEYDGDKLYSIDVFETLGKKVCQLSFEQLKAQYPKADPTFFSRGCGGLAYFFALTRDAYGLSPQTPILKFKRDIGGTEVSWALGRMLYEVNLRSFDRVLPSVPGHVTFWIAIIVLTCALGATLLLLLNTWRVNGKREAQVQNLMSDDQQYV